MAKDEEKLRAMEVFKETFLWLKARIPTAVEAVRNGCSPMDSVSESNQSVRFSCKTPY